MFTQTVKKYEIVDDNYDNICLPNEFLKGIYCLVKFSTEIFNREGNEKQNIRIRS